MTKEIDRDTRLSGLRIIAAAMRRQLEVSDQYAREKADGILPTVWEIQNRHLRDRLTELDAAIEAMAGER